MECNSTVYFENKSSDPALESFVKNLATTKYDLSVEDQSRKGGVSSISLMGGSSTDDGVEGLIKDLNEKGVSFVRAYVVGDEDPWCKLLSNQGSLIITEYLDPGIFEHLAGCSEHEIDQNPELKEANSKGPLEFFKSKFNDWKEGLDGQELVQISSEIEAIIEYSAEML